MNGKNIKSLAKNVIDTEIKSLQKLKKNIKNSFLEAVKEIVNCKNGKVIVSGVGKSGIIAKKISSTLASVGTPSFYVDASSCSHGDLGQISSNDLLILISYSGETAELKNIIQYANRNKKIKLIGIVSKKNSLLYRSSDIKILLPEVKEAGPGNIVPTSSTITQLAIGDAIAITTMKFKKFGNLDFKRFHPSGSLGAKLKTVEDLMLTGNKIPFIKENAKMKDALKIITLKKLGVLIALNKYKKTTGIITDGQIRRALQKSPDLKNLFVKNVMTLKPIVVDKNILAAKALEIMNTKKITCLCVRKSKNDQKTVGIIHIHNILEGNIS
ncbi:MAG: arabinose-5-phosphate isomerase [Candidatus Pelagibacter sp. TMED275]|nr:MAG: arabinose-5-phosphate isomerase [Candidatus Pelagibacter sp. TMED275]|tara:strand:+ start:382 stop:1362 length:981 start_codon:yes stop_codon:yes gene_type:complete